MRADQAGARLPVCFSQPVPVGFAILLPEADRDNTERELAKLAERY
jgi:hypothetical protein